MRILLPTAGTFAAENSAHYIIDIAARLNADVVALHIARDGESEDESTAGPRVFAEAGREAGVNVTERVESGKIVPTIHMVAGEVNAGLIIMGASNGTVVGRWTSSNVGLAENGGDPSQEGCFFEVADVEAAHAELVSYGLDLTPDFQLQKHGDSTYRLFFVVAPDGLCYCLGVPVAE